MRFVTADVRCLPLPFLPAMMVLHLLFTFAPSPALVRVRVRVRVERCYTIKQGYKRMCTSTMSLYLTLINIHINSFFITGILSLKDMCICICKSDVFKHQLMARYEILSCDERDPALTSNTTTRSTVCNIQSTEYEYRVQVAIHSNPIQSNNNLKSN